jgi:hypothetical protein
MKIHKTQDYNLFKRIEGNRKVNAPHVARLKEAINHDPQTVTYNPILVNKDFEIIDGQHRFDAIRQLHLPVYYMQVDELGLSNVQSLNSVAAVWTPLDYARSYAELGNQHYTDYLDFKSDYKLNHAILVNYLSFGREITAQSFKDGKFTIPDPVRSTELLNQLVELREIYPHLSQYKPALGLLRVMLSEAYDHNKMVGKFKIWADKITEQRTQIDYSREFERIFNFKSQTNVRLF